MSPFAIMRVVTIFSSLLLLLSATSAFASSERVEFDRQLTAAMAKLDREGASSGEQLPPLADLIQRAYGTSDEELEWAASGSMNWGEIAVLAYIQATTGRSFEQITQENARSDFGAYAENAGMDCDKMAHSLDSFIKRAEKERNSKIFERLRASRRIRPLPDLGSGFGLFQEALDFRGIDAPAPLKIHTDSGLTTSTKGGQ